LNSVSIYYRSGSAAQGVNVRVEPFTHDDRTVISLAEWEQIKLSVKPVSIPAEDWNVLWANIPSRIGTTWGHYVRFLNRLATELSVPGEPVRDVRAMFEQIYAKHPDYRPSSLVTGRLLESALLTPVANIEVGFYGVEHGRAYLAARATTDAQGRFTAPYLQPGSYTLMLNSRDFDNDRDGEIDDVFPTVTVTRESDPRLDDLFAYTSPPAPAAYESGAAVATDSNGRTHMAWVREGAVWHAYWNGTAWINGLPVSSSPGANVTIRTATNLINGSEEGVFLSWVQNGGNDAEVFYSIGRPRLGGGYEWSLPGNLTRDSVHDAGLDAVILNDGRVLVTVNKSDQEIQDDTDGYYYLIAVNDSELVWPTEVIEQLTDLRAPTASNLQPQADWSYELQASFNLQTLSKGAIFGIDSLAGKVSGDIQATAELEDCVISLGGSIGMSVEGDNRFVNLVFSGSGSISGSWNANKVTCAWEPKGSTLAFNGQVSVDIKNALTNALRWFGPQGFAAATGYEYVVYLASRFSGGKLQIENGINITVGVDVGVEWDEEVPFPDWLLPDRGTITFTARGGPYVKALWGDGEHFLIKASGFLEGSIQSSFPAQESDGLSGRFGFEVWVQIGWFNFTGSWGGSLGESAIDAIGLAFEEQDIPLTFQYNPAGARGTTNVYGTNTVLATAGSDVVSDGAMSLAKGPDGRVFAAWARAADPNAAQMGNEIYVLEFAESGWGVPVAIPGTLGLNRGVTAATDQYGRRMVVWSHSDSTAISPSTTLEELLAIQDDSDLYYSVFENEAWSEPRRLAATPGSDARPYLAQAIDGQLAAVWQASDSTEGDALLQADWDGTSWSLLAAPITTGIIGDVSIGRLGNSDAVFWSQSGDPGTAERDSQVYYATRGESNWSVPVLFLPGETETTNADSLAPALYAQGIPLPSVPDDCCKCDKIDTVYQGTDQGCGFTVEFDEDNCKKIITYKPCVPPPVDPNDIVGPIGYGDENWIAADRQLEYMIRFENDPVFAQAPAQKVVVTQKLDSDLDYRSFRLGDFGFGGWVFQVPANRAFYSTRIDLVQERGYFVDVTAGINIATGEAFWTLVTIDPETGEQPLDPTVGFLVINNDDGDGEGFLSYSVRPRRTARTGDVVDAEARIVFDTEAPIDTPPIFNTLDAVKPQSVVQALPATADDVSFQVTWTGSDDAGGSGLAAFNVFVSDNDGPFVPWLLGTQLTEAEFLGAEGHRYAFYSVAFDNAGNQEGVPTTPDATTVTPGGTATIGDFVWADTDGDGIQDDGESGMADVIVKLYYAGGGEEPLAETTTDADGGYRFPDLDIAQSYFLEFVAPAGYAFSPPGAGDDALDSDAALDTGRTEVFTVVSGLNSPWDAGLLEFSSISGLVWRDTNGDEQQNDGEPVLPDQVVYLDSNQDGDKDDGEPERTTDANGRYVFENLRPGHYVVRHVVQDGWEQTHPGAGGATAFTYSGSDAVLFTPGETQFPGLAPAQWSSRLDVDGDGYWSAADVIVIVNALNADGFDGSISAPWQQVIDPRDINADGLVSPLDALIVINRINASGHGLTQVALTSDLATGADSPANQLIGLDALRADARFADLDGHGVSVVVIDTGIDSDHAFFGPDTDGDGVADRIVFQYDFADGDANAGDLSGHGSHVSSIIASQDNTYPGVAPAVDVIHLKVFSDTGRGSFSYLEQALQWVIRNVDAYQIAAVNLSLGDGQNWASAVGLYGVADELAALDSLGVITVSAAGNSYAVYGGSEGLAYPAADPHSLAVGAVWDGDRGWQTFGAYGTDYTTAADRVTSFSQRDAQDLDALAPGALITAANATGGVATMRGTSMAAPYVTGAAVLAQQLSLQQHGQRLSLSQFRELLRTSGAAVVDGDDEDDNVPNTGHTYFRLDLAALADAVWNFDPSVDGGGRAAAPGAAAAAGKSACSTARLPTPSNWRRVRTATMSTSARGPRTAFRLRWWTLPM
jgi:subtilisin family serine protease/5-hydroxyisourate hydrolase-like protein (transthyretin family)